MLFLNYLTPHHQQGRATKGAANALLGKVQLQNGNYDAAKAALLKVYGKYSLVPYLNNFDGDIKLGSNEIDRWT